MTQSVEITIRFATPQEAAVFLTSLPAGTPISQTAAATATTTSPAVTEVNLLGDVTVAAPSAEDVRQAVIEHLKRTTEGKGPQTAKAIIVQITGNDKMTAKDVPEPLRQQVIDALKA